MHGEYLQGHGYRGGTARWLTVNFRPRSDYCLAAYDVDSSAHAGASTVVSLIEHLRVLFTPFACLPFRKLGDLHEAVDCLADKSKSFYTSSFVFEGRLQLDLLAL